MKLQRLNSMDCSGTGTIKEHLTEGLGVGTSSAGGEHAAGSIPDRDQIQGAATILVVEDDESICWLMSHVLATHHHHVLSARNADEGWSQWSENRSSIKLLIADIMMPGGPNGLVLANAIQKEDASVPVIFTSVLSAVHKYGNLDAEINFLPKPFRMNDLLTLVSRVLARHALKAG